MVLYPGATPPARKDELIVAETSDKGQTVPRRRFGLLVRSRLRLGDPASLRVVALLAQAPRGFGLRHRRRLVAERLQQRLTVLVHAGQQQHLLLRLAQLLVAELDEPDALLVAGQRLVQPEPAVLQLAHRPLQVHQRLLERPLAGQCLAHGSPVPLLSVGSTASTRLTIRPCRTCVTIRSPGRTCRGLRTRAASPSRRVRL